MNDRRLAVGVPGGHGPGSPGPGSPGPGGRGPGRRRRWPIVVAMVLVLAIASFVVVDRVAVRQAQDRIATRLATEKPFTRRPTVHINGVPFLTQAARGVYRDIAVRGPGAGVGRLNTFSVDAHLRGVHVPLSKISDDVRSVPVDRADVAVTVPLSVLAAAADVPGLRLQVEGDVVKARAPAEVPGLGEVDLAATVDLRIRGGDAVGTLSDVQVGGIALPAVFATAAGQALVIRVSLPDLPFDAQPTRIERKGSDVTFLGVARNLVLE